MHSCCMRELDNVGLFNCFGSFVINKWFLRKCSTSIIYIDTAFSFELSMILQYYVKCIEKKRICISNTSYQGLVINEIYKHNSSLRINNFS